MWFVRASAVLALSLFPMVGTNAIANGLFTRNYVVAPTTYVEAYPTSYFQVSPTFYYPMSEYVVAAPTSYVVPMSWSVPIVETRYVQQQVYAYPTTYVTSSTWFYPTAWISSTVYRDVDVDLCCTTSLAPLATQPVPSSNAKVAPRASAVDTSRLTPSTVDSVPMERAGAGNSAFVEKKAEPARTFDDITKRETTAPPPVVSSNVTPIDPGLPSPPVAPAPEKESPTTVTPITPAPASPANAKPPVAPGEEPITLPNAEGDAVKRESMKPVTPTATLSRYLRTTKKGDLNVLEGRVISSESGQPEDGVTLMIASRSASIGDQQAVTDAAGHYSVRLPDGQWIVRMKMPSGKIYTLSQLVVKSGQINDDLGRDIPTLNITR